MYSSLNFAEIDELREIWGAHIGGGAGIPYNQRWRRHKKITKPNGTIGPPKNRWDMQKKSQNYKLISPFFSIFTNNDLGLWREKSQNSLIEIPYCHT